jgi:hypothetical protein
VTKLALPQPNDREGGMLEDMKKGGTAKNDVDPKALDASKLVPIIKHYDLCMDVKWPNNQTHVVVGHPHKVQVEGVDQTLYKVWQPSKYRFVLFVTLWCLGVEEDNFLKLKSASTSMVYGLKFSTNIELHSVEESVLDRVVRRCFMLHQQCH